MLVLDRSLSMEGPRLDAAKTAGRAVWRHDVLAPTDRFGIVAIDDKAHVLHGLTSSRRALSDKLTRLTAGGAGNGVREGLRAAYAMLDGATCRQRHVLLVTDYSERLVVEARYVAHAAREGIRTSALALGPRAGRRLRTLARLGRGELAVVDPPSGRRAFDAVDRMMTSLWAARKPPQRVGPCVVFGLDRSRSMGRHRLAVMRRATLGAVERQRLGRTGRIGVIAFDAFPQILVDLTPARHKRRFAGLAALEPTEGSTWLRGALELAYAMLDTPACGDKQVVLITDGGADGKARRKGLLELVTRAARGGVRTGTIALGAAADRRLLQSIALVGGGLSFYLQELGDVARLRGVMLEAVAPPAKRR